MKKKYLKFIIIGVVIVFSTVAICLVKANVTKSQKSNEVAIETTIISNSSDKVYVNGVVKCVESKNILLDATKGKVDSIAVEDGQAVNAGDVLFTYKNDTITSQIEEYNNQLTSYSNQKNRLESKKSNANNELAEKKNNLSTLKAQLENNPQDLTLSNSIEGVKLEIQSLETEVSTYDDQLNTINDSITAANKKVASLKNEEVTEVKADFSGVVNIVGFKDDYTTTFMTISSNDLYIKGTVNEKFIAKLKKDQEAEVLVIANNKTVKGKVDEINTKPIDNSSALGVANAMASTSSLSNYEVTIILDSQEDLFEGYHIQATIYEGENEVVVPKDAIVKEKKDTFVYKVSDGILEKQKVSYENKEKLHVLKSLNMKIEKGEFLMIMGKSGSGKTTLMNSLGFLDRFNEGVYLFNNEEVTNIDENKKSELRNKYMGFIFQQFHLIDSLTIGKNVELPLLYKGGVSKKVRDELVLKYLTLVGLEEKINRYPKELSGGQQQRVAIARALINDPYVIFADEPTGALDSETGIQIMNLLKKLNEEGKTIIMVTHDGDLTSYATRVIKIKDGVIFEEDKKCL